MSKTLRGVKKGESRQCHAGDANNPEHLILYIQDPATASCSG